MHLVEPTECTLQSLNPNDFMAFTYNNVLILAHQL